MKVLGLVVTLLVTACEPGRHPSASPTSTSSVQPATTATTSTSTSTSLPPSPPSVVSVDFLNAELGWAVLFRPCGTQTCWLLYASNDGGASWKPRTESLPLPEPYFGPRVRMASPEVGWLVDPKDQPEKRSIVLATRDGGRTWREVPTEADGVSMEPQGRSVWRLEWKYVRPGEVREDSLLASDDYGATWHPLPAPPPHNGIFVGFSRPTAEVAYVLSDGRLQPYEDRAGSAPLLARTADGGRSWTTRTPPCTGDAGADLDTSTPRDLWLVCSDNPASGAMQGKHLYRSSDGGDHWSGDFGTPNLGAGGATAVASPTRACRGGSRTGIRCTFDGGRRWEATVLSGGQENYFDGGVGVVEFFGLRGWATGVMSSDLPLNLVWRTTDGGHSWSPVAVGS